MLFATVCVVAVVPLLGYVGVRAILDSRGGTDALKHNLPKIAFPATPTALLITSNGEGRLTSVTVFVLNPAGVGGSVISVPVSADFGFTDDTRASLQDAYTQGGLPATLDAVASLLPVTVNFSAEFDPEQLAGFLTPLAPFPVELSNGEPAAPGHDSVPAGLGAIDAVQAARMLTSSPKPGQLEAVRRSDVESVWAGVVSAVGHGHNTADVTATVAPTSFDELAARLFAGVTQTRGLTVQELTPPQNPTHIDVEQLDRSEAVFVFASICPGAMSPTADGPTFRLVAPPGYDAAVKRTIEKLLYFGGNIVSVDTTASPQPDTVFYVPDDIVRVDAESTNLIFGDFTFGTPTERIDGIDLTVVLGTDYLSKAALS
jgi:hypothetical protein